MITQTEMDVLDAGEQCLERLRLHLKSHERMYAQLEHYKKLATQRGARMQILHEAIIEAYSNEPEGPLHDVISRASEWFDADGVPVRW